MTKSEKKIADYMLQKRGDPQFMSITTFAKNCQTNDIGTIFDTHLQVMGSSLLSEEEVIWCFSYSGATKDMIDVLKAAHKQKTRIILVTRYVDSPASKFADVVLVCGSNESPLQSGALVAKVAQLYVIDMVYQAFLKLNPEDCEANRVNTTSAIAKRLL